MRDVCRRASELLDYITPFVKAGVSTLSLDELMLEYTEKVLEAKSACLNYCPPGMTPYPRATCISVNNVICHGIPSEKKILKNGDIVNIDVTIVKDGFYGDTSRMFIVGKPTIAGKRLVEATWGCMWAGIEAAQPGNHLGDIGYAVQKIAEDAGYGVVREYVGHGVGRNMHEEPNVPNYGHKHRGIRLEPGMVIAIEPMINMGTYKTKQMPDGWLVVTRDGKPSAHFEKTIAITEDGPRLLTVEPDYRRPINA